MPLVSFLLAVHDGARYLGGAVDSVLAQTVRDLELIVIDDASTDATPDLLAGIPDERLTILRNDQQTGLAASLNRGLEVASGRYAARLDDDEDRRDAVEVLRPLLFPGASAGEPERGSVVIPQGVRVALAFGDYDVASATRCL